MTVILLELDQVTKQKQNEPHRGSFCFCLVTNIRLEMGQAAGLAGAREGEIQPAQADRQERSATDNEEGNVRPYGDNRSPLEGRASQILKGASEGHPRR